MKKTISIKKHLSSFQIILLGFLGVILLGTLILMLPISSASGEFTPFFDSLFTATSAVCVTGLVVVDTATHWSLLGQIVIITLIQIGGLGVVTVAASFAFLSGRKIGLMQRSTMQEAMGAQKLGGIVRLLRFILLIVVIFELCGAALLATVFISEFGVIKGLWYSIFHSISAFCNAGFDLMGIREPFSSLTFYIQNPTVNLTICALILFGGIGFLTWDDITTHKFRISKYRLQSKLVLITTAVLVILPTLLFMFTEFKHLPVSQRILPSLFQAVTPRTAGFNTADFSQMSEVAIFVMIILMLIGGASGSTAGGMKMNTIAVLFANLFSVFKKKKNTECLKRTIPEDTVLSAATIFVMYITLFILGTVSISLIDGVSLFDSMFEVASAVATVGLTKGITPSLSLASRLILILLMFFGRVGGLTIIYSAFSKSNVISKYPTEKITVG